MCLPNINQLWLYIYEQLFISFSVFVTLSSSLFLAIPLSFSLFHSLPLSLPYSSSLYILLYLGHPWSPCCVWLYLTLPCSLSLIVFLGLSWSGVWPLFQSQAATISLLSLVLCKFLLLARQSLENSSLNLVKHKIWYTQILSLHLKMLSLIKSLLCFQISWKTSATFPWRK